MSYDLCLIPPPGADLAPGALAEYLAARPGYTVMGPQAVYPEISFLLERCRPWVS
jgi:hypothetical protein